MSFFPHFYDVYSIYCRDYAVSGAGGNSYIAIGSGIASVAVIAIFLLFESIQN